MRLVIFGKEPIADLVKYVNSKFSEVPNSFEPFDYPWKSINPISEKSFESITWVDMLKFTREIEFIWQIPDQLPLYKSKPAIFLSSIIGYDGEGGLLSYLKLKGCVTSVSVGIKDQLSGFSTFVISIGLTGKGLLNYEFVISSVFSYLNFLKTFEKIPSHLFEEFSGIAKQNFHCGDKAHAHAIVTTHVVNMQHFPPQDILTGPNLVESYDCDAVSKLLHEFLIPEKVSIFILANGESMKCDPIKDQCKQLFCFYFLLVCDDGKQLSITFDQKEPWFGAGYHVSKMDKEFVHSLNTALMDGAFRLPCRNRFISTDLTIHGKKTESVTDVVPKEILKDVWFKQDDTFMLPKGEIMLRIMSPHFESIRQYTSLMLWNLVLADHLLNSLYPAAQAGLSYFLFTSPLFHCISVGGYSEKLFLLLDELLDQVMMKTWAPDASSFSMRKSTLANSLGNTHLEPPFAQGNYYLRHLLAEFTFGIDSVLATLEGLQLSDIDSLESIFPVSKTELHFEALVHGNFKPFEVLKYFEKLPSKFTASGLSVNQSIPASRSKVVQLPRGQVVILGKHVKDPNSCAIVYFQVCALTDISF